MKSITRSNVNYANINITCQCILRNATYNISVTNKYFHEREKVLQQTTLSATKKQKLKHKKLITIENEKEDIICQTQIQEVTK